MEKIKYFLIVFAISMVVGACQKDKPHDPQPKTPGIPTTPELPTKSTLILPENGQPCFLGTSVSATQSSVGFSWTTAAHADSYELHIKNLLTGDSTKQSTNDPSANVNLLKNTPYSWYVVSKSSKVTFNVASEVWKFYNSGPGVSVFPPYPAQLVAPANGAQFDTPTNGLVQLQWTTTAGSSPIKETMVYLGDGSNPSYLAGTLTSGNVFSYYITPKTLMYWRIVTKDMLGNTSSSEVYSFYAR